MNQTYLIRLIALMLLAFTSTGCVVVAGEAATQTAVTVAQERSVGRAVDDTAIYAEIKHLFLQKDINALLIDVGVEVVEGRVLLTGAVRKPETAIEAVRLSWQVDGVREVINEIQVTDKSSLKDYARDVWISAQIKSRLLFAKNIQSINYSIETVNSVVYLIGLAQNEDELGRVVQVARTTKYVQKVISHVRLKTDPRRPY